MIGNSLKFTKRDIKSKITISLYELSEHDVKTYPVLREGIKHYKIVFADNGIGFEPEHAVQIFNIFQRLHRKSEFQGTGIGLAMCKKIVSNHKGYIDAKGSSDNGAIFNIILPETISAIDETNNI